MADVAGQINAYLTKRGSPMAGLGNVFVAAGKKYGVDPRLVVSISGIESGFGAHILGDYNAWGWGPGRSFASWEEGISAVTKGLREGYLNRGLMTPQQIVGRYAPASDGNDEHNWSNVVSKFMRDLGAVSPGGAPTTQRQQSSVQRPVTAQPPANGAAIDLSQVAMQTLMKIARGEKVDAADLLGDFSYETFRQRELQQAAKLTDPARTTVQGGVKPVPLSDHGGASVSLKNWKPGSPIVGGTRGGQHATDGLPGFPAYDWFAPAGSPVVAPVSGRVYRFSGHDPSLGAVNGAGGPLGWSLYIQGSDGTRYYLTHMGSRTVSVGQTVQAGQPIGTVADYDSYGRASHIHMGVSG